MAGIKANSFILRREQQQKSGSRCPRGARGYLAEMTHQPASTTAALSHLCASGLFLLPDTNTRSSPHASQGRNLQHPTEARGKAKFQHSPWAAEPPIHPCVPWQSPKSNENPSKDLGKQTKLCTDEMSSSGKKRLDWLGKRAERLISRRVDFESSAGVF